MMNPFKSGLRDSDLLTKKKPSKPTRTRVEPITPKKPMKPSRVNIS